MLGKLLGLSPKKPSLPKNQIELVCPVCGSMQREPRLVVTTVCRKCGEHLRVEKKKVIASSQINPVPSAVYPAYNESRDQNTNINLFAPARDSSRPIDPDPLHTPPPPKVSARIPASTPTPASAPAPAPRAVKAPSIFFSASDAAPAANVDAPEEPGLGNFLMGTGSGSSNSGKTITNGQSNSDTPAPAPAPDSAPTVSNVESHPLAAIVSGQSKPVASPSNAQEVAAPTRASSPVSTEGKASAPKTGLSEIKAAVSEKTQGIPPRRTAALPTSPLRHARKRPEPAQPAEQSTFQKMREQGFRQQHFKEVECFDCNHKFKVGRSARNSICPNCSSSICLEDVEINVTSTAPIRTRGDVYIRKMGNVSTSEIKCRDLHLQGIISANVECSGEMIVRTAGTIIGEIHCVRLNVVKGSDVQLINTLYTKEAEIHARICGNIHCEGPVLIGNGGCVEGDVSARSVNIEPGGHLDGSMNILRPSARKTKTSAAPNPNQPTLPL